MSDKMLRASPFDWSDTIESASVDQLRALQLDRLKQAVGRALAVPHYQRKFAAAGVAPADIESLADLARLPFTTKENLRQNYPFGMFAVPLNNVDTNRLQASILLALKPDGKGLTVVGDDAQSIYSFRAATVRNILDFPEQFTPPARIITLDRNYRSTQPILAAANAVIDLAAERHKKNLRSERPSAEQPQLVSVRDETDQARYVVDLVLEYRESGVLLKQQAVLFRASHHSAQLELELMRRNIPFVKYGGLKFLEAAHIKDVLAFLRWAENLRDRVSGFRAIQLLPGAGPATAARLLDRLAESNQMVEVLLDFQPSKACAEDWPAFADTLRVVRGGTIGWPAQFDLVCRWYAPHLERLYEDAKTREADLVQLAQIASTYPNRERFLTELTLDPPTASGGEAGCLCLMRITLFYQRSIQPRAKSGIPCSS